MNIEYVFKVERFSNQIHYLCCILFYTQRIPESRLQNQENSNCENNPLFELCESITIISFSNHVVDEFLYIKMKNYFIFIF